MTIVLTRDRDGQRPDQMFYCTKLDWMPGKSWLPMLAVGPSNAPLKTANSFWVWKTPPTAYAKAVERTAPMALLLYTLVVVWFHVTGHLFLAFPDVPGTDTSKNPRLLIC